MGREGGGRALPGRCAKKVCNARTARPRLGAAACRTLRRVPLRCPRASGHNSRSEHEAHDDQEAGWQDKQQHLCLGASARGCAPPPARDAAQQGARPDEMPPALPCYKLPVVPGSRAGQGLWASPWRAKADDLGPCGRLVCWCVVRGTISFGQVAGAGAEIQLVTGRWSSCPLGARARSRRCICGRISPCSIVSSVELPERGGPANETRTGLARRPQRTAAPSTGARGSAAPPGGSAGHGGRLLLRRRQRLRGARRATRSRRQRSAPRARRARARVGQPT